MTNRSARLIVASRARLRPAGAVTALLLALLALAPPDAARAQPSPIIGAWSISYTDPSGRPWLTAYLQFFPNGALRLKGFYVGGSEPLVENGSYQLTQAGSAVQMVFTDFSPKQCVSIPGRTACEPPPMQLNQPIVRGIQFVGPNSLRFSDGATYTRAPGIP
jgi:hypothetical protein